ncbi:hypothetical protein E4U42_007136 [Claviceps africana]|uniref:Uncharacterized protein n=1 Tax=Claviceps africana TaxID=83212 RepID=A0A8K0NL54_9HYPO|nr:hypothetical protein E4U42_007136 [Claviceps africana]
MPTADRAKDEDEVRVYKQQRAGNGRAEKKNDEFDVPRTVPELGCQRFMYPS